MSRRADREREIAEKLDALTLAGVDTPPACEGDEMFIAERVNLLPTDMQRMRMVCNRCPLFALCDYYARTARPDAGFWAGSLRERRNGRTRNATAVEGVTSVDENGELIEQEVPC